MAPLFVLPSLPDSHPTFLPSPFPTFVFSFSLIYRHDTYSGHFNYMSKATI